MAKICESASVRDGLYDPPPVFKIPFCNNTILSIGKHMNFHFNIETIVLSRTGKVGLPT